MEYLVNPVGKTLKLSLSAAYLISRPCRWKQQSSYENLEHQLLRLQGKRHTKGPDPPMLISLAKVIFPSHLSKSVHPFWHSQLRSALSNILTRKTVLLYQMFTGRTVFGLRCSSHGTGCNKIWLWTALLGRSRELLRIAGARKWYNNPTPCHHTQALQKLQFSSGYKVTIYTWTSSCDKESICNAALMCLAYLPFSGPFSNSGASVSVDFVTMTESF